jgi:hypothetical protein
VNVADWPAVTDTLAGCVVTTGGDWTDTVTELEMAEPLEFVATARYWLPSMAGEHGNVSDVPVAPLMFVNDELPAGATCHCTVGVGLPLTVTDSVSDCPDTHDGIDGVIIGATGADSTVSVAAFDVTDPLAFVTTARYRFPSCATETLVSVNVVDVAPLMFENVVPPFVDTCHCTVSGARQAAAPIVKLALPPENASTSAGCSVNAGPEHPMPFTVSVAGAELAVPTMLVKTARY